MTHGTFKLGSKAKTIAFSPPPSISISVVRQFANQGLVSFSSDNDRRGSR